MQRMPGVDQHSRKHADDGNKLAHSPNGLADAVPPGASRCVCSVYVSFHLQHQGEVHMIFLALSLSVSFCLFCVFTTTSSITLYDVCVRVSSLRSSHVLCVCFVHLCLLTVLVVYFFV